MSRRILVLVLSAIAIPATAQTFGFSIGTPEAAACLPVGSALYRLAAQGAPADYTVRIDPAAAAPDLRVHLSETADQADFVLVDDGEALRGCRGAPVRSVKIDAEAVAPDLVMGLVAESANADYRIYVRSHEFAPTAAAALLAAARLAGRKLPRRGANHSN